MNKHTLINRLVNGNRFYYGWIITALASLCYFFSGPGQTYFTSAFIDSYIKDFNWNRASVSSLYSIATLVAGFLLFIIGRMADKYGQKKILLLSAFLLGAYCMWNSFISSLWMLFLGFFLGRLTGQGSMTLLPSTIVPQWFIKKRAFTLSLMSIGGVIGSAILPPINTWLINIWGWSNVWRLWSVLLWFLLIPLVYYFLFNKPEDLGLLPYSRSIDGIDSTWHSDEEPEIWTLKKAMGTRSFWGMLYCQMLSPLINTGIVFHFISIMGSKGMSASTSSFILSLLAIISFPATFLAGFLLDRMKINHATAFICLLQVLGLVLLLYSTSLFTAVLFALVQGMSMGLQSVCGSIVWPEYYGISNLGSIRGTIMTASIISSALGPIPLAFAYDVTGSYAPAILVLMILPTIGIVAALLSPKPIYMKTALRKTL